MLIFITIMSGICLIAFIQTLTGPEFWWNFFGNWEPLVHFSYHGWVVQDVFRPFAIFNNSGRFMHLLHISYFYFLLTWTFSDRIFTSGMKKYFWVLSLIYIVGFFYSMSRTSFLSLSIISVFYVLQIKGITTKDLLKQATIKRVGLIFLILIVVFVSASLFGSRVSRNIDFLYQSVLPGQEQYSVPQRIGGAIDNLKKAYAKGGWLGRGTGTGSLGATYITGKFYAYEVESGYSVVLLETGIIGLILWLIFWGTLLRFFFLLKSLARNYYLANIIYLGILAILTLLMVIVLGIQTYQSWIFNILFWNFLGILIGIYQNAESYGLLPGNEEVITK